jgi:hypothetical protein
MDATKGQTDANARELMINGGISKSSLLKHTTTHGARISSSCEIGAVRAHVQVCKGCSGGEIDTGCDIGPGRVLFRRAARCAEHQRSASHEIESSCAPLDRFFQLAGGQHQAHYTVLEIFTYKTYQDYLRTIAIFVHALHPKSDASSEY